MSAVISAPSRLDMETLFFGAYEERAHAIFQRSFRLKGSKADGLVVSAIAGEVDSEHAEHFGKNARLTSAEQTATPFLRVVDMTTPRS